MARPKRILSGDEYISKTEKMVGLPKKYPNLSKAEKMIYLPRFYYNDYEKIDDGFLNYIPINYQTTIVQFDLRSDTAFGYPTWKSVFGGYDFITFNGGINSPFLWNSSASYNFELVFYQSINIQNGVLVEVSNYFVPFLPALGFFYDSPSAFDEYKDNDKFSTYNVSESVLVLAIFNSSLPAPHLKNTKVPLFNNNRAKVIYQSIPL
jgi:hypothetical protein